MKEETLTPHTSRDYCEQLHANRLDNQKEIDKFLEA